jgi:hypothetical protein
MLVSRDPFPLAASVERIRTQLDTIAATGSAAMMTFT